MIVLMRKHVYKGFLKSTLVVLALSMAFAGVLPGLISFISGGASGDRVLSVNGLSVDRREYGLVKRMFTMLYERYRSAFGDMAEGVMAMQGLSGKEDLDASKKLVSDLLLTSLAHQLQVAAPRAEIARSAENPQWLVAVTGIFPPPALMTPHHKVDLNKLDDFLGGLGIPQDIIEQRAQRYFESQLGMDALRLATPLLAQAMDRKQIQETASRTYSLKTYKLQEGETLNDLWDKLHDTKVAATLKPSKESTVSLDPRNQEALKKMHKEDGVPVQRMLLMVNPGDRCIAVGSDKEQLVVAELQKVEPAADLTSLGAEARAELLEAEENIATTAHLDALRSHGTIEQYQEAF